MIVEKIESRKKRTEKATEIAFTNKGDQSNCLIDNEEGINIYFLTTLSKFILFAPPVGFEGTRTFPTILKRQSS